MTEEEFLEDLIHSLPYSDIPDTRDAGRAYARVLNHLLESVIDPRDSTRGVIYALQKRLENLEKDNN